jgi:hypothetical protein
MDRANQIKWSFRVGYTPDTTFRQRLSSVNRSYRSKRCNEQDRSDPIADFSGEPQKHFRFLQEKRTASINSDNSQRGAGDQMDRIVPDLRNVDLFDTIPGG